MTPPIKTKRLKPQTKRPRTDEELERLNPCLALAVYRAGGQEQLGHILGRSQPTVSLWFTRGVPLLMGIRIEERWPDIRVQRTCPQYFPKGYEVRDNG
jgi:hypothetical protein